MRGSVAAETLVRWKRVERETMGSRFHRLQSSIEERREEREGEIERERAWWPRYGQQSLVNAINGNRVCESS